MSLLLLMVAIGPGQRARNPDQEAPSKGPTAGKLSQTAPVAQAGPTNNAAPSEELKTVLAQMNQAATRFKSLQADFEWENFDKLINETDTQKGKAYFRRLGSDTETLFNFYAASPKGDGTLDKQALYQGGVFRLYEPKINRVTERDVGKNRSDVDAFMSLGLGGRGDALAASFTVNWQGWETVEGVKTAKLEVTGKSPSIQKVFSKAVLWIDPERDIAVKQQFFQTSGDYRLVRYHNIKFNEKVADNIFRLKTTGTPEVVHLHGN
jgi:outer membrane lipoprotein-sorting protein